MVDILREIQQHLDSPHLRENLTRLFCETLHWERPQGPARAVRINLPAPRTLDVQPVSRLGSLPVLRVDWPGSEPPNRTERRAVYEALSPAHPEHLLCYVTTDGQRASFVWARQGEQQVEFRSLHYERGTPARTTLERLAALAPDRQELSAGEPTAADRLQAAFDVEVVRQRFVAEYAAALKEMEEHIQGIPKGEARRLYTQRLFNRLLFLYFLEHKGWLSFQGDRHYLRALFHAALAAKEDFLNERLYWAFFHGLNTAGDGTALSDALLRERRGEVPFLNGGLFDLEDDYDVRGCVRIPNAAFAAVLDVFERYRFTVTESTPLDIEVAVDPEMLGKVFEELVTGRHETGSYYTPRPIVAFMCREALKLHLRAAVPDEAAVTRFVDEGDPSSLPDLEAVLEALKMVQVCDPACGSGAYLLGMMQELLRLRETLCAAHGLDAVSVFGRKWQIIQNNLYGVDLDPFAVNIAKLRLWLSLAVDFEGAQPPPLPNLEFKIQRGDALTAPDPQRIPESLRALLMEKGDRLAQLKGRFLEAHGAEKGQVASQLRDEETALRDALHERALPDAVDWRVAFADVFTDGGFDIVLTNPPYVRKEQIPPAIKDALRANFSDAITGHSDLYCSFYARGVQLLKAGGAHVYVCSNAWLDAGYGACLQKFLLDNMCVCAIYDSAIEKQFSTANVNTMISVLHKVAADADTKSRFVLWTAPFQAAAAHTGGRVETAIAQAELRHLGTVAGSYVGGKWGGKYLRAPRIYKRIFGELASHFTTLAELAEIAGYIHDNNAGGEWPEQPVLWSIRDARSIVVTPASAGVRHTGINPVGNSLRLASILFARTYGTRHLVIWAEKGLLGKEFYKVLPHSTHQTVSLVLQLNSTLGILQREVLGIRGLGGGAIKFAAADVGRFQILPALNLDHRESCVTHFLNRPIRDIDTELRMEDRRVVDAILFDCLGLDANERREVYRATLELVNARRAKARRGTVG